MGIQNLSALMTSSDNRSASSGFTLIEVVLVLVISGILAAAAIPVMTGMYNRTRISGAADLVTDVLEHAKGRAKANPIAYCGVYFEYGTNRYYIFDDVNKNRSYDSNDSIRKREDLGGPFEFTASSSDPLPNQSVIFRADGAAVAAGEIDIQLGSKTRTIGVSSATGFIRRL